MFGPVCCTHARIPMQPTLRHKILTPNLQSDYSTLHTSSKALRAHAESPDALAAACLDQICCWPPLLSFSLCRPLVEQLCSRKGRPLYRQVIAFKILCNLRIPQNLKFKNGCHLKCLPMPSENQPAPQRNGPSGLEALCLRPSLAMVPARVT